MNTQSFILTIDTSDISSLRVSIHVDTGEFTIYEKTGIHRAQRLLPLCMELLSQHSLSWEDIRGICVVNAFGSITGLRVGFAVANTLGFLLGVPVNGLPAMENIHPKYGHVTYLDTFELTRGVDIATKK